MMMCSVTSRKVVSLILHNVIGFEEWCLLGCYAVWLL
jgi:hypothetical protein